MSNFYRLKVRFKERRKGEFEVLINEIGAITPDPELSFEIGDSILLDGIKRDIPTFRHLIVWGKVFFRRGKLQIDVINFQMPRPEDEADVYMFLVEGEMGIDRYTARELVDDYDVHSLRVFTHEKHLQKRYPALTDFLCKRVIKGIDTHYSKYEFNSYLGDYGFTRKEIMSLNCKYVNQLQRVLENPFVLLEQKVSFKICDAIAMKEEIPQYYQKKTFALIYDILVNNLALGTHISYAYLFKTVADKLDRAKDKEFQFLLDEELKRGIARRYFWLNQINGEYRVGLDSILKLEDNIATQVFNRIKYQPIEGIDNLISDVESENPFKYAEKQKDAIKAVMNNQFSIITGGPGVGKTTVVDGVLKVFNRLYPDARISLCAPSGKASKRLQESTGRHASTIHSLFGLTADNNEAPRKLMCDLLVVDETSMIDMYVADKLLSNINKDAKIVFVGDVDQLESVDAGNVLYDLIHSEVVPVVKLDLVQRQSGHSSIAINAKKINQKNSDLEYADDFQFIETSSEKEAQKIILDAYRQYKDEDAVILSPVRAYGAVATSTLNPLIQAVYTKGQKEIKAMHKTFRLTDIVMQTVNNKTGNNGDTGVITAINGNEAVITFDDGRQVTYDSFELGYNIELSYAQTIHKSQGSEYPIVIMPVLASHKSLNRNLIYTGITRARKKVIMIGQKHIMKGIIDESLGSKPIRQTLVGKLLKSKVNKK